VDPIGGQGKFRNVIPLIMLKMIMILIIIITLKYTYQKTLHTKKLNY